MSNELRAAANEIMTAWKDRPVGYNPSTKEIAGYYLADAYLAEYPADDGQLAMPQWMEEIGLGESSFGRTERRFEIVSGVRIIFFACEGPKCWRSELWVGSKVTVLKEDLTRGDVRRLCKALGVTLKE